MKKRISLGPDAAQREHRQRIDIGPGFHQVTPVATLYRNDVFENEEQARGAFELAHQQGLDGMGPSVAEWMGLTSEEFGEWMARGALPSGPKRRGT